MDGCSFLRGQSSPRLQATVVSTLSAFESKNLFAAKGQMHFQNQNIMDDPTHGNILILRIHNGIPCDLLE